MRKLLLGIVVMAGIASCTTNYDIKDTGIANGKHDMTMYEYFQTDLFNWDSLLVMIDRAGLQDLFEGKRKGFEDITFWGPTNYSVRRWMLENDINSLTDVNPEECERLVLAHVVKGRTMLDDIPRGSIGVDGLSGGMEMTGADNDNPMLAWTEQLPYNGVIGVGAVVINLRSLRTMTDIDTASSNIETNTGVVHSLHPNYTLGEL